ncbi:MAG: RDD family protein, partial [Gammaproteobacteria bacterium]|nr:RDD family protein [Gammaproteobacteria bacterium]
MAPNQVDTTMGGDITPPPRLSQRLGAMLYDALLLAAVVVLAGLPLPLIPEQTQTQPLLRLLIQLYLVSVCFVFFGWFWVHGGQTLGMRAWRVKLTRSDDRPVDWRHAGIRFVSA